MFIFKKTDILQDLDIIIIPYPDGWENILEIVLVL